jgi:hypothetical protein
MPAHPAVHADDNEEDLAARLAPQIQPLRCVERATDGRSDENGEQQDVAHDANGPRRDLATHAQQSACQAEPIADDLPPQNDARTDLDLGLQQPQEYFLEIH